MIYDEEHMLSIAEKYANCTELLSLAITDKTSAQNNMSINYKGMASDLSEDVFVKIEEHLKLLVSCCETAETYVKDSLSTMQELDAEMASDFNGMAGDF